MKQNIDCHDPECFDADHTHEAVGQLMNNDAYYSTKKTTVLVPVEIVYYENIGMIQTYNFPKEHEVEKALQVKLSGSFKLGDYDLSTHEGRQALKNYLEENANLQK